MRKIGKIIILSALILILSGCNVFLPYHLYYKDKIVEGIHIYGVYVGGKTKQECRQILKQKTKDLLNKPLTIQNNSQKIQMYPKELGMELQINKNVEKAFQIGRGESFLQNILERRKIQQHKLYLNELKWDENRLKDVIKEINEKVYASPQNAQFKIVKGRISIVPSQNGVSLDEEEFKAKIVKAVLNKEDRVLKVPIKTIKPDFTTEEAEKTGIEKKISSFYTTFNPNKTKRSNNIKKGVAALNNILIHPGEVFSFNKTVGPRDRESGFQMAPVYINKKLTLEPGGGICQVSSTLYNLVLRTGLEIIERQNHSRPVSYVPMGLDATVYYDTLDFKFKNNKNYYLLLHSEIVDENKILMEFYGPKEINIPEIHFESEVIQKIPEKIEIKETDELKPGEIKIEKGKPGYKVRVWKINQEGGNKELLYENVYEPVDTIIYIGSKDQP